MKDVSFVAVDWGTSGFRLWVIAGDGTVVASCDGPFGMSRLKRSDYPNVLEESLSKLGIGSDVPVIICGMAGAAQGWCEAPYLAAPTRLDRLGDGAVKVSGTARDVRILPGVKQVSPANVMRGEETQIAGLLNYHPDFEGTVCLPGTHTKWVFVKDKTIRRFETCMTGELFAFFSETSVLSHSMIVDGWSDTAFRGGIKTATQDPTSVPKRLFSIRANMLVGEQSSGEARASLSGLLIGQELMSVQQYWENQTITLIGAEPLCELYLWAFDVLGIGGKALDTARMTLSGLQSAHFTQKESTND
jgi:2-dehydro-3-deoxygalactonokinase